MEISYHGDMRTPIQDVILDLLSNGEVSSFAPISAFIDITGGASLTLSGSDIAVDGDGRVTAGTFNFFQLYFPTFTALAAEGFYPEGTNVSITALFEAVANDKQNQARALEDLEALLFGTDGVSFFGTDDIQFIRGTTGHDYADLQGGSDRVEVTHGNDTLLGGAGQDWITVSELITEGACASTSPPMR